MIPHYYYGKVLSVESENANKNEDGLYAGQQQIKVKLTSGPQKGEIIDVINRFNQEHSYYAKPGHSFRISLTPINHVAAKGLF